MEPQTVPTKTYLIHRHKEATKYQFTTSNASDPVTLYYILAPPKYKPAKHHKGWSAIIHTGNDPKSHTLEESPITGRIKRAAWWKKIYIETGGTVMSDVKTDEKRIRVANLRKLNKLRKVFCLGHKQLEWSTQDEDALQSGPVGESVNVVMEHEGHRKYGFEFGGVEYRWTGTKMHAGSLVNWMKLDGFAYSVKLVRIHDKSLIASYEKKYNMCGSLTGHLHFYTDEKSEPLPESVIVNTAFGMIRAEKHKRDTVWEILQEIAENAGG